MVLKSPILYDQNTPRGLNMASHQYDHFKGKESVEHVAETQAQGILSSSEIHGTEIPGHLSSGADAARDTAVSLLLLWLILSYLGFPFAKIFYLLAIFSCGWMVWKCGRSAWLGWYRLERLHRVLEQEKWEIEHNRPQERDELRALYGAKGFEGKLLEDVIDVLMADGDRLLKVMVEEELRLTVESQEHPLKQSLGALIGSLLAVFIIGLCFWIFQGYGVILGALLVIAISSAISAKYLQNRLIPAIVWNLGIALLAFGFIYFLLQY